eukprot:gene4675-9266_t
MEEVIAYPVGFFDEGPQIVQTMISSSPTAIPLPLIDDVSACQYLTKQQWPKGLQDLFLRSCNFVPIRFIVVDDSGSMSTTDGRRVVIQGTNRRYITCSRWSELTESLKFHATLADIARTPTEFRFLNNANPILIGCGQDESMSQVFTLFDQSPGGGTPLCGHIRAIVEQLTELAPQLRANGQRAALIIATDGESSDGDITEAMKPLQYLPVWVVIRLCTAEERVCEYWNNIDKQLELDMDVLDDIEAEAADIHRMNDWFTYGEPIHRLREFGVTMKDLDLIDEHALSSDQMRNVLTAM